MAGVTNAAATEVGGNKLLPTRDKHGLLCTSAGVNEIDGAGGAVRKGSAEPLKSACLKSAHSVTDEARQQSLLLLLAFWHMVRPCVFFGFWMFTSG